MLLLFEIPKMISVRDDNYEDTFNLLFIFILRLEITHIYIPPAEINNSKHFKDGEHELEKIEVENLTEWLAEHYSDFGAELYFITDKSAEGCQFVKGFSGIGGFLRYKVELDHVISNNVEYNYEEEEGFI